MSILSELLSTDLFEKIDVAGLLTEKDFQSISASYYRSVGADNYEERGFDHHERFNASLMYMTRKYGENYAKPNPLRI